MAGAFFFICMFLITVGGLLLFRPVQLPTVANYSQPKAIEERKKVTVKMAEFLEQNPQIIKQKKFASLFPKPESTETNPQSTPTPATISKIELVFQGATVQFSNTVELDQWIYYNATQDPINFLKQFLENDNPEFYLETLKKVSEIKPTEEVNQYLKQLYLDEAKKLSNFNDGFHKQMMQKALQSYLDLEKDRDLGKKNSDEILHNSR
jgi:hypothetical protein